MGDNTFWKIQFAGASNAVFIPHDYALLWVIVQKQFIDILRVHATY